MSRSFVLDAGSLYIGVGAPLADGTMARAEADEVFEGKPGAQANSRIESLFREHNDTLLRFLRARLHSEADAREAAQEAYVRLLQLDDPGQLSFLRAYLFRIAANVATDLLRRRTLQTRAAQDSLFFAADEPATQERGLEARQQLAAVELALSQLPPKCREAFLLSRREGWASGKIAAHLGVSDRMVRLYLVRALEHLEAAI